jgi:hypothetical protein
MWVRFMGGGRWVLPDWRFAAQNFPEKLSKFDPEGFNKYVGTLEPGEFRDSLMKFVQSSSSASSDAASSSSSSSSSTQD